MFLVLNKEKICAYLVSIVTVVLLFLVASNMKSNNNIAVQTSSSLKENLPIYSVKTDENKVALTMNCAWNADDIDSILETLNKKNVKITFFIVGDWIEKFPDAVKKIYEAGHEIGTHSDTHPHVNNLSYEKNVEQLARSNEKIEKITEKKADLYRAPYGEYNDTVIKSAKDNGYYTIQWSLDTLDYTGLTGEEMWNRLNGKIKKGDIILMHNGTEHTADSLEYLINKIKEKNLEIVKVSDLIYKDNYYIDNTGMQIKSNNDE